jgi:hypothetical protein
VLYHKKLRGDKDELKAGFPGYFMGWVDQIDKRSIKPYMSFG